MPLSSSVIRVRRVAAIAALGVLAVALWFVLRGGASGPADEQGAKTSALTIDSNAVGEQLPVEVVTPRGAVDQARPLLVFLHGRGQNERSQLVDGMYAALADEGKRAPVIAFPYGGESSYWHDRADGDWAEYVTREVIPEVESRFDVDPERVAIGGISMGGYGAFEIAAQDPGRFCAIGGHSPALWQDAGESAEGAFDDAEDFDSHDVIAEISSDPSLVADTPLWVDAGDEDPFLPGDEALTSALRGGGADLTRKTFPGGHEAAYWNAHWDDYLPFYAKALASC